MLDHGRSHFLLWSTPPIISTNDGYIHLDKQATVQIVHQFYEILTVTLKQRGKTSYHPSATLLIKLSAIAHHAAKHANQTCIVKVVHTSAKNKCRKSGWRKSNGKRHSMTRCHPQREPQNTTLPLRIRKTSMKPDQSRSRYMCLAQKIADFTIQQRWLLW